MSLAKIISMKRLMICITILAILLLLTACAPEPTENPPENGGIGCICTMDYTPVCGVDGNTYPNACAAGCQNVEIDHEGEC